MSNTKDHPATMGEAQTKRTAVIAGHVPSPRCHERAISGSRIIVLMVGPFCSRLCMCDQKRLTYTHTARDSPWVDSPRSRSPLLRTAHALNVNAMANVDVVDVDANVTANA